MKKKKSKIRVIYKPSPVVERKPDCPACGLGFMTPYAEVDTERETRINYMACYVCGAGFDELGNTWGSLTKRAADLPVCTCGNKHPHELCPVHFVKSDLASAHRTASPADNWRL